MRAYSAGGLPITLDSPQSANSGPEAYFRATFAGPFLVKIEAVRLDSNIHLDGFETQAVRQETFPQHDAFILDLDHLLAIGTDNVKGGRRLLAVDLIVA